MKKEQGKKIFEEIFCIRNTLVDIANKDVFGEFELTFNSYIPLKMVSYGLETVTQMREVYNESAASLGQKIQKLENMGLVERELDNQDKRRWNFKLTKKGEKVLEKVEEKFRKVSKNLFGNLSQKEQKDFLMLLNKVENSL